MRTARLILLGMALAAMAVVDALEFDRIYRGGFPPIDFYERGLTVVRPTLSDRIVYFAILALVAGVQVALVRAMVKVWRRRKQ